MISFRPPPKPHAGFTLAELLVAMAIASIVTLVLLSLVGQSSDSYAQTQRAVGKLSQARAFIQFFERELTTRLPGVPLIHQSGQGGTTDASAKIAVVRALSLDEQTNTTPGDLGTSVYYVAFSADRGGNVSPKLFRKTLNPLDTQNLVKSAASPGFPPVDPAIDEAILYNVLEFAATPQYRDSTTGALLEWNDTSPLPPTELALTLRFIDESSAPRYTSEADWNRLASSPRDNERRLIRTFTRRISIAK